MILLREYTPEDYPVLAEWWKLHGWAAIPANILPKLGAVAVKGDVPLCAAFLYMDNSVGVCWLEWLVSNPKASPFEVMKGVRELMGFLEAQASVLGYGVMLTTCRQASLVRLYESAGFAKTDEGVTHLLKIIGGQ